MPQQLLRTITKAYPPQIHTPSLNSPLSYLHCPLDHWIDTQSPESLQEMLPISDRQGYEYEMGMNMNNALMMNVDEENVVLQDGWGMWVEEAGQMRKKFGSQKEIVSNTVSIGGKFVNLDEEGAINSWHKDADSANMALNPQSYQYISDPGEDSESQCQPKRIIAYPQNTPVSVDFDSFCRRKYCSRDVVSITANQQGCALLQSVDNEQNRMVQIDLEDGIAFGYSGFLPSTVTHLLPFHHYFIAYGGEDAFLIDSRTCSIALNLNPMPQLKVGSVLPHSDPNQCYVAADNALVSVDLRRCSIVQNVLTHQWTITSFGFMQQDNKQYCILGDPFSAAADIYSL